MNTERAVKTFLVGGMIAVGAAYLQARFKLS